MKKVMIALALLTTGCATAPYTNPHPLNPVLRAQEIELSNQVYAEILKENRTSTNAAYIRMVANVGTRISTVADQNDFNWEFKVLKSDQANAFCLPGGKVAFYDAIMPICGDENGVAAVMGHEIAHALASHSVERMTHGMGASFMGDVLSVGLSKSTPETHRNVMQLFGIGAQGGAVLPFSREQESEADHIGLILMAKAGYDPRAAIAFWERMEAQSAGDAPPPFLSMHPSDRSRVAQMKAWLPEAMQYYRPK